MRRIKTKEELIMEGYQAEGAVAFLHEFIEQEKDKQLQKLLKCPVEDMNENRATYQYICNLEKVLIQKIEIGISYATEQAREGTR